MLQELIRISNVFKNLYYHPIEFTNIFNTTDFQTLMLHIFFLLFFMILLHSVVIYIGANIFNSYPYFKMITLACSYSFTASFMVAKILQMFFLLALYFMPYIGQYFLELGTLLSLGVIFIFEFFLMKNRLNVLYQRGHLDTEPISNDIFLGVALANTAVYFIFSLV